MDSKKYTVRRVFADRLEETEKCYSVFDFLHRNPYKKDFLRTVLLHGRIWAVYDGEKMIACCCYFPGDMEYSGHASTEWNTKDLLGTDDSEYLVMGYIYTAKGCDAGDITALFARLGRHIAMRSNIKKVLHCSVAHINTYMGQLMSAGYTLAGLRGLDKLIPHYIFISAAEEENHPYKKEQETEKCPLSDTKQISRLCEQGYCGIDLDGEGNIIFIYGR